MINNSLVTSSTARENSESGTRHMANLIADLRNFLSLPQQFFIDKKRWWAGNWLIILFIRIFFYLIRFSVINRIPKRFHSNDGQFRVFFRERLEFFPSQSAGECQEFFGGRVKFQRIKHIHTAKSPTEKYLMTISLAAMEWNFEFVKWNFLFSAS